MFGLRFLFKSLLGLVGIYVILFLLIKLTEIISRVIDKKRGKFNELGEEYEEAN